MARRGARAPKPKGFRAQLHAVKDVLQPDTLFACSHPLVGEHLPGRAGGTITGCATPSKQRPKELQLYVGLPGLGHPVRLSTARRRLREGALSERSKDPFERGGEAARIYAGEEVHGYLETGRVRPTRRLYPGRRGSSRCDPEHPVWARYPDALEAAEERASIVHEGEALTPRQYERAVGQALKGEPEYATWKATTEQCAQSYLDRTTRRDDSPQAERARELKHWTERGGDPGEFGDYYATVRSADPARPKGKKRRKARAFRQ